MLIAALSCLKIGAALKGLHWKQAVITQIVPSFKLSFKRYGTFIPITVPVPLYTVL
jgi:hypothetical protein